MAWKKTVLLAFGGLATLLSPVAAHCDDTFGRALALASEKRYSEARDVLDPLLARDPGHARARALDGILRARSGRLSEAVAVFEALRRDYPDMIEAHNNLAVIYAVQDRLDDARTTLLEVLEHRPDAVAYANLGDVYTKLARRAYRRARELDPGGHGGGSSARDGAFALPLPPDDPADSARPAPATGSTERAMVAPGVVPEVAPARRERSGTPDGGGPAMAATPSTPASFCAHAGGFGDRRAVADAALWLQSYGAEVLEVRHEQRQVVGSYRVYLPPHSSREAAAAKLREIRNRGVRDVGVIGEGALENGISFGIYRNADNLHRRVAALDRIGYSVRSVPEDVRIVEDYVIRARAGGAPATLDADWASRFPEASLRVVECG